MKRMYESVLNELLGQFPCVAIIGPRQCGKTTLLKTLPSGWTTFDLERHADLTMVERDPDLFFALHPDKVAIDEAQNLPALFNALRVAIDEKRNTRGRFVVTGSSSPGLLRSVSESLAGRVAIIEMGPLAWAEVKPTREMELVRRLCERSAGPNDLISGLRSRGDTKAVHDYWFRGGYPEPWLEGSERFGKRWMEEYTKTYLDRDVAKLFPGLDHTKFRMFLQHLAGYSGTIINCADVARALGVSQPTASGYFQIAHGTFIWRHVPAFVKNVTRRIVRHAKGYMRDSGLLHYLLRIPSLNDLLNHPRMGASWEGMVIDEIIRQMNCCSSGFDYSYYRASGGGEIDLVLEGEMGLIAVEIKYSQSVDWRTIRTMTTFIADHKARIGIIVGNGPRPELVADKLISVPFAYL